MLHIQNKGYELCMSVERRQNKNVGKFIITPIVPSAGGIHDPVSSQNFTKNFRD